MTATLGIPQIIAEMVASGTHPADLADDLPGVISVLRRHWGNEVLCGRKIPDLKAMAQLAVIAPSFAGKFDHFLTNDAEMAALEAEHRVKHPLPGEKPFELRREATQARARLRTIEREWNDAQAAESFALDALPALAAIAPAALPKRPSITLDHAAHLTRAAISSAAAPAPAMPSEEQIANLDLSPSEFDAYVAGTRRPRFRHNLLNTVCGVGKTFSAVSIISAMVLARREEVDAFVETYRTEHPTKSHRVAMAAAKLAGKEPYRIRYAVNAHVLGEDVAAQFAKLIGTATQGGTPGGVAHYKSPERKSGRGEAKCTELSRRRDTRAAGELATTAGCMTKGHVHCPKRATCGEFIDRDAVANAEVVVVVADQLTGSHLISQLNKGFSLTIFDESCDRLLFPVFEVPLDHLDGRHLDLWHVLKPNGQKDPKGTRELREWHRWLQTILGDTPDGYFPMERLRSQGFVGSTWETLRTLNNARDRSTGLTSGTDDQTRSEIAQTSQRKPIAALCGMFTALMGKDVDGRFRLATRKDGRRVAVITTVARLHPTVMDGDILAMDGGANVESWKALIGDIHLIDVPAVVAPHEHNHQIIMPTGKHALRDPMKLAVLRAMVGTLGYRKTDLIVHQEHEEKFADLVRHTGHHNGVAGLDMSADADTQIVIGSVFLDKYAAAYAGAARSGRVIPVEPPVRTIGFAMKKGGGLFPVPSMGYRDPDANAAMLRTWDNAMIQNRGRGRGARRGAANPLNHIYIGAGVSPGAEFKSVTMAAPGRMYLMLAEGFVPFSAAHQAKLFSGLTVGTDPKTGAPVLAFPNDRSPEYDAKVAKRRGGYKKLAHETLYGPANQNRVEWLPLFYRIKGRGRRQVPYEGLVHPAMVAAYTALLRERCGADEVWTGEAEGHEEEVPVMPLEIDLKGLTGTSLEALAWQGQLIATEPLASPETPKMAEHPPDG